MAKSWLALSIPFEHDKGSLASQFYNVLSMALCCRLGIPDTEYSATVKMPSSEFQRIVK